MLGLAFKPDTDDIRESPAIRVIESLLARNTSVKAYDPAAIAQARKVLGSRIAFARKTVSQTLLAPDPYRLIFSTFRVCTSSGYRRPLSASDSTSPARLRWSIS